jgi:hypothetical protein
MDRSRIGNQDTAVPLAKAQESVFSVFSVSTPALFFLSRFLSWTRMRLDLCATTF